MKIYLASPFFDAYELECVQRAEELLTARGFCLFSPRQNEVREGAPHDAAWSMATFCNDRRFIDWADAVVALYHGSNSDSGTAWEIGYAYASRKPVIVVHVGRDAANGSNLMVHEGCHANLTLDELRDYDFERMPHKPYEGVRF